MKITNKIAGVAVILMATTNPLVAVHINDGIDWFFSYVIIANSGVVSAVAGAYLVGLYFYKEHKSNKVHVPVKAIKSKGSKSGMKYEVA